MTVFDKIIVQQVGKEGTAAWMVGEQLKDICQRDPASADILDKDLDAKGMGIEDAEKKDKGLCGRTQKLHRLAQRLGIAGAET